MAHEWLLIDNTILRTLIIESQLSYSDIEQAAYGMVKTSQLKDLVTGRVERIKKPQGEILASILCCDLNALLSRKMRVGANVPVEINILISGLYKKESEKVFPQYADYLHRSKECAGFNRLLNQARQLVFQTTKDIDTPDNNPLIDDALSTIVNEFTVDGAVFSASLFMFSDKFNYLIHKIKNSLLAETPSSHRAFLLFTYAFILFMSLFWGEMLASALFQSPYRWISKGIVEQFAEAATHLQYQTVRLLDWALHPGTTLDNPEFQAAGLDLQMFEDTQLLLLACERLANHFEGDFRSAEYLNIAQIFAIRERITGHCQKMGFGASWHYIPNLHQSFFGKCYLELRILYFPEKEKPKQKSKIPSAQGQNTPLPILSYMNGFNYGVYQALMFFRNSRYG